MAIKKIIAGTSGCLLLAFLFWEVRGINRAIPDTAEEAMSLFHSAEEPEALLQDPLILAGTDVVPLVLAEVMNANMPRRRYAIGALGHIGDKRALPALESLVENSKEEDYIRTDALESIDLIAPTQALSLATKYSNSKNKFLAEASRAIINGKHPERRTKIRIIFGFVNI